MRNDPYSPNDLDPASPLVQGLSANQYKIVNHEYQRMVSRYSRAIEELDLRFLKLKQNLDRTCDHTVIRDIRSRLKSAPSMCEKITRLKLPCTLGSIQANLYDIAGLRVICSYIDDVYDVLAWIKAQEDFHIKEIKDYIRHPKKSGYRSLHVIFSIQVYDNHSVSEVFCEIQLRTTMMDSWAALEHQLQYKNKKGRRLDPKTAKDLRDCASLLNQTDLKMQEIFKQQD